MAIGGGTAAGADAAARRLIDEGCEALVSFGLAGGLDPALRPGALIVPTAVIAGDDALCRPIRTCRGCWAARRRTSCLAPMRSWRASAEKRRLHQRTGAAAVDLESGAVARVAAARGVPFAVLRAICDPAERALPPAALAALDARGAIGVWRVVASLVARPDNCRRCSRSRPTPWPQTLARRARQADSAGSGVVSPTDGVASMIRSRGNIARTVVPWPGVALDRQRAAMQGQQFPADRQPEAAAAEFASDRGVRLLERLAQRFQRRRIDADAGVGHDQGQRFVGMFDVQRGHPTLRRELHGIGQQIEHDLLQRARVAAHGDAISVQPVLDPHAALVRPRPQHADAGSHHHAKLDDFIRKVIAARLDLREIEHVIDHVEQMMAGRVDLRRIFDVVRADLAERLVADQLREANDGIQRRAQLVAHVGEEFRLGAARRLRTFLGVQKLGLASTSAVISRPVPR